MSRLILNLAAIACILCSTNIMAQEETPYDDVMTGAQKYLDALMGERFEELGALTNRSIVEKGGGEMFFVEDCKREANDLKASGMTTIETNVQQNGEEIVTDDQVFTVVPYKWIVNFGGSKYISTSHILGTSADGKEWKFVNLSKFDAASLKVFLPGLPKDFDIPVTTPFEPLR